MCVSHINTPTQHAGVAALLQDQTPTHKMICQYEARRNYLESVLAEMPGVKAWHPQGALYFFVDVSATGLPSSEVWMRLLEEAKVFTFPGDSFGIHGDRFLRMSFANTPIPVLEKAKERMMPFFGALAG
jgi:aspartate/methionine/tyrosine aminotransferase